MISDDTVHDGIDKGEPLPSELVDEELESLLPSATSALPDAGAATFLADFRGARAICNRPLTTLSPQSLLTAAGSLTRLHSPSRERYGISPMTSSNTISMFRVTKQGDLPANQMKQHFRCMTRIPTERMGGVLAKM